VLQGVAKQPVNHIFLQAASLSGAACIVKREPPAQGWRLLTLKDYSLLTKTPHPYIRSFINLFI
jgi:hypothetical protein